MLPFFYVLYNCPVWIVICNIRPFKMRIEIDVPSNLSEITLSQYKRYLKLVEDNKDGDLVSQFISLKMLEIF